MTRTTRTATTDVGRLRGYRRAQLERVVERIEPFERGFAVFTPTHPTKWDLNLLFVDEPAGAGADELIAAAERLQAPAGLRHRKVTLATGGDELVDDFAAAGWLPEEVVVMALRRADVRGTAGAATVREVGFEAVRELMEAWYGESMSPTEARDLAASDAATAARNGARFFLAERDGDAAACCELLGADGVGQVEEVYTAAAHRGHGLASAVIRTAIAASRERGDDVIVIYADAADWPQKLYERLGFETVDRFRSFTRKPSG